ncbi:hypothetical protein [Streptomyces sp. NBC_01264]|uniref:hypothetical protein n=1 Tax=Streptomyces sp. NBC_01264 TaxID=2903804 RepID=UPI00225435EB|nr:hypothetical protein [Streptomyces sp. NBC_01264]MCX4783425.1 hypothetical protein [Streptomyces sp. NBC_01264]
MPASPPNPPASPIIVDWGKEQVEVSTVDRELPEPSAMDDRSKLVKAGVNSSLVSLPEDAWHAVARGAVTPETVALQLRESQDARAGLLLEEHVDGATLRSVHSRLWLSEIFPAIQPRTGQELLGVEDPRVGGVAEDGKPQAILRYLYDSPAHLRKHVQQTISATLYKNSYAESILARRVTRALIVHPVVYEFEDGSDPVYGLIARDGITRLASAWNVFAGSDHDPEDVGKLAADVLVAEQRPSANDPVKPLTQRMALARENWRKTQRTLFTKAIASVAVDEAPPLAAIRIAQSYVVPAHVTVGVRSHDREDSLNAEEVFDDALRSILASVHVEFKPWDSSAQNVEVVSRALKRVLLSRKQDGLEPVYELAVGRRKASEVSEVYKDPQIPGTGLWRAVRLLHTLTRPAISDELRNRAKEIKGERRMTDKGYASLLGPIVDHPWRSTKKAAAQQARNAWSNGGVLFKEVLADGWAPIVTDDFTTLVEPALGGNQNARLTLALAGGTALIADKILTRNVGSSVGLYRVPGKVPFRADVYKVIEGLAQADNALGLWTLALAAQRFEDGRLPRNSGTKQAQGLPGDPHAASDAEYQHLAVDLEAEDRVLREDGEPVLLLEWDVVVASDQERAALVLGTQEDDDDDEDGDEGEDEGEGDGDDDGHDEQGSGGSGGGAGVPEPPRDISDVRRVFKNLLSDAKTHLDLLERLGEGVTLPPVFGMQDNWAELRETSLHILKVIANHEGDYKQDEPEEG